MRIVLLEDDPHQSKWIQEQIQRAYSDAEFTVIATEVEFVRSLHSGVFREAPPVAFVLDIMVRWTDPSPKIEEPPADVQFEGFYRAGIRCLRRLRKNHELSKVPVVLFTILDSTDLDHDLMPLKAEGLEFTLIRKEHSTPKLLKAIENARCSKMPKK